MIFRMISFCIEKIDLYLLRSENIKENRNAMQLSDYRFIDFFNYIFYPTFFFISPFVTYASFYKIFVSKTFYNFYKT